MKPSSCGYSRLFRLLVVLGLGATLLLGGAFPANAQWDVVDLAVSPDNRTRLLWERSSSEALILRSITPAGALESSPIFGPHPE